MKIKIKKNNNQEKEQNLAQQSQGIKKEQQKFKFSLKKENTNESKNLELQEIDFEKNQENFEHDVYFEYQDDSQEFKNIMFNSEENEEQLLILNQSEHILDLINQNQENSETEMEYLKWMKMSNVEDFKEFLAHSPRFPND